MLKTNEINIRDPFVLLRDGVYFLYGTRGATCWGLADGFDAYTGTDLENWEGPFTVFENDGSFWADRNYWAPEVHVWQGAYYMFASFKNETRRRGTAILKASSPLGPFTPWSDGPVTPADWECLDGTFYADKTGKPYMVFCHEWVQAKTGGMCVAALKPDFSGLAEAPRRLFDATAAAPKSSRRSATI